MPVFTGTLGDDFIGGTDGDDVISGLDGHDNLVGGPATTDVGDDVIDGGDGNDIIRGRGGNDTLTGGDGNDYVQGGEGDDIVDGGAGFDRAAFVLLPSDPQVGATVDLNIQGVAQFTGHGWDTLIGIEHVSGTALDDVLTGDGGANWIWGEGGMDILNGGDGDDYLRGGEGDDQINGGAGFDRAAFVTLDPGALLVGATVDLNIVGAQDTGHGFDTLTGIEHVSGTEYDDTLTGDGGANWLWGEGGIDVLTGNGGDDLLETGEGGSTLSGGSGVDTASFYDGAQSFLTGATVSLAIAGAQAVAAGSSITLIGIENLSGSLGNDVFTGNNGANTLAGQEGDDTLNGGDGDDVLMGDGMITVDTHGTGYSGPIVSIEDVSDDGFSVAGNDILNGGKGNDRLIGGAGDDTLTGDQGHDVFAFSGGSGADVVTDYKKNQDSFELNDWGAYTVTAVGKDVLISNGVDTILVLKAKASDVAADISTTSSLSARSAPASALVDDGAGAAGFNGWADQSFFAQHGFRADGQAHHDWYFG